tara:strand:- start:18799 stop:19725 length:927 start_codon:yes stop_codon:yes gene_type:complete
MQLIVKIFFLFFFTFFFNSSNASNQNKIVIKVDGKIVSSYDLKNKINTELILRNLEINQSNIDKIKNLAIQELINSRVKENEISKYKIIKIEEMDISNYLNTLSSNNIEQFKQIFNDNKLDYNAYIKELKVNLAWQKLIFILFNDRVKIDDKEIIKEIESIRNEKSLIKEYDLSELELSYNNDSQKKTIIEKIKNEIKKNGFEKSVAIYSEAETAKNSGKLGLVNEKSLSTEIYKKLMNLNEGDVSEPIIKLNKIIFLKVNKIKKSENKKLDTNLLKKNLINKKKNDLFDLYSKSHLSKIKNSAYIEF